MGIFSKQSEIILRISQNSKIEYPFLSKKEKLITLPCEVVIPRVMKK
jgi:hypothetical protein